MSADCLSVGVDRSVAGFRLKLDERFDLSGVTGVFGPSGSGKSTLLRVIAGFDTPQTGSIKLGSEAWFDATNRIDVSPHRRPVGLMFQDARLFTHLTARGNLAFADQRSVKAGFSFDDVVEALQLGDLLDRSVLTLSGGERQRVSLGRTLLTRPRLLLLDEPLSALDADRKAEILPYLETALKRFAIPTLYVSHSIDEVARLADRLLLLTGGQARAHGPIAEVVERMDLQPITGRFEGGVLVEGVVESHDSRTALTSITVGANRIKMPSLDSTSPGTPVRLRIRARDVSLATQRPVGVSIRNVLPGEIIEIEIDAQGPFAEALVDLGGVTVRSRLTREAVEELRLRRGARVFALIKSVSFDGRAG